MQSKKEILKDLLLSAETGRVLKLKLKDVPNPVITAVDKISKNKIALKSTCLYGYPLEKTELTLLDIEGVKRYKANFDSPLFQKLRFLKNNIKQIRNNITSLREQSGGQFSPGLH